MDNSVEIVEKPKVPVVDKPRAPLDTPPAPPVPQPEPEQIRMPAPPVEPVREDPVPPTPPVAEEAPWRLAGEVLNTYLIVERGDEILLIDKHAAHERILFEKLKANQEKISSQMLLSPVSVRLSPAAAAEMAQPPRNSRYMGSIAVTVPITNASASIPPRIVETQEQIASK